jgi:hypothetical protein
LLTFQKQRGKQKQKSILKKKQKALRRVQSPASFVEIFAVKQINQFHLTRDTTKYKAPIIFHSHKGINQFDSHKERRRAEVLFSCKIKDVC